MMVARVLGIALPLIMVGGVIGALVGDSIDDTLNGIRVGVILGGLAAFVYLKKKKIISR